MDIDEFATKYGVHGHAYHLMDFVTHTEPDERGRSRQLLQRQWAVIVEHADVEHGDQRVLLIDYATGVGKTDRDIDVLEVLGDYIRDAAEGRWSYDEYAGEHSQLLPDPHNPSQLIGSLSQHPLALHARWISAVSDHHRLTGWCSSEQMIRDIYDIED